MVYSPPLPPGLSRHPAYRRPTACRRRACRRRFRFRFRIAPAGQKVVEGVSGLGLGGDAASAFSSSARGSDRTREPRLCCRQGRSSDCCSDTRHHVWACRRGRDRPPASEQFPSLLRGLPSAQTGNVVVDGGMRRAPAAMASRVQQVPCGRERRERTRRRWRRTISVAVARPAVGADRQGDARRRAAGPRSLTTQTLTQYPVGTSPATQEMSGPGGPELLGGRVPSGAQFKYFPAGYIGTSMSPNLLRFPGGERLRAAGKQTTPPPGYSDQELAYVDLTGIGDSPDIRDADREGTRGCCYPVDC